VRARLVGAKATVEKTGAVSKEQLATLAKELARYELRDLPSEGKPTVNAHLVTIKFGKQEVTLMLGAGEALPKVDPRSAAKVSRGTSPRLDACQCPNDRQSGSCHGHSIIATISWTSRLTKRLGGAG
jgi:hypothetical protein